MILETSALSAFADDPPAANDVWIAALCRQHDLPLLSRDRHFEAVKGLRRMAW